ncbi:MAG: DNA-3-methyladenine glycosylase I [Proteobacteria bacterium]|nr:DNA-3-methyladenine glycosylase I [Pseudomonadota bacterium]
MNKRCAWAGTRDYMIHYHDQEWGRPVHDDLRHFEMITLEGAQAGLSWDTILRKRAGYREAFAGFDPKKVAAFDEKKQAELLQNPGIVRNRLKVASAIRNARAFLDIQKEFGSFDAYIWAFAGGEPIVNQWKTLSDLPAMTPLSDAISKDLKMRGFNFVGSTIIYAYLQATGLVNDHTVDCYLHPSKKVVMV